MWQILWSSASPSNPKISFPMDLVASVYNVFFKYSRLVSRELSFIYFPFFFFFALFPSVFLLFISHIFLLLLLHFFFSGWIFSANSFSGVIHLCVIKMKKRAKVHLLNVFYYTYKEGHARVGQKLRYQPLSFRYGRGILMTAGPYVLQLFILLCAWIHNLLVFGSSKPGFCDVRHCSS